MKQPLITVVVPVYKTEQYLHKCMESILNQTHKNLQIILVDDGSPDNCPQLCDAYARKDTRITVIHQENGGVSCAKNAGMDAAAGDYIGFVDSDDWIEDDMFETLLCLAQKYGTEISMCGYVPEYGFKRKHHCLSTGVFDQNTALQKILIPGEFEGFLNNKLFSYKLLHQFHFEGKTLRLRDDIFCEDLLFLCQAMININAVAYTTKQFYHYLIRPDSETGRLTKRRMTELVAKKEIIDLLHQYDTTRVKALYSISASTLVCRLFQSKIKDRQTIQYYQQETKRYFREFRAVHYPAKDKIRMLGVLLFPPLFCPIWNFIKEANKKLSYRLAGSKKAA